DDEAWQASQSAAPMKPATKTLHRKEATLATLIVTLVLLAGGWLWQRPDPAQRTKNQLQSALVQEKQSLTHTIELTAQSLEIQNFQRLGDSALAPTTVKIPGEEQTIKIDKLQHLGDRVMAQVIVKYPEEGNMQAYRETRFFEKNGDDWQRIAPDPALL